VNAKIFNFGRYAKILFFKLRYFHQKKFSDSGIKPLTVYLHSNFLSERGKETSGSDSYLWYGNNYTKVPALCGTDTFLYQNICRHK